MFGNCPECEELITSLSGNVTAVPHSSSTLSSTYASFGQMKWREAALSPFANTIGGWVQDKLESTIVFTVWETLWDEFEGIVILKDLQVVWSNNNQLLKLNDSPVACSHSSLQNLVLPPILLFRVASSWCPRFLLLQSALECAQAPCDQQYFVVFFRLRYPEPPLFSLFVLVWLVMSLNACSCCFMWSSILSTNALKKFPSPNLLGWMN